MNATIINKVVTPIHVFLYRIAKGRFVGRFHGGSILLLTTVGRRSGKKRTRPLMYFRKGDDLLLVASNAGRDRHPGWFWNLKRNSVATIQIGSKKRRVRAREASPGEREVLWPKVVERFPGYGAYEQMTTRKIPILVLSPNDSSKNEK